MDLFSTQKTHLNLPDAELTYIVDFLPKKKAKNLFESLKKNTNWQQDTISIFGKTYNQPRLTALFNDIGKTYSYSNITMYPEPFSKELLELKLTIEEISHAKFNSVLLNLYRNGQDSNSWHADNEKELGPNPTIASLSLGADRIFHFKHRQIKSERHKITLANGSLLMMSGAMQHHWLHQIPKTKKSIGERINLTFRQIY